MSSATYKESDLPPLPTRLINPIKQVIHQMLCIDPKKRPKPEIGANIVAISLFGMKIGKVLDEFSVQIFLFLKFLGFSGYVPESAQFCPHFFVRNSYLIFQKGFEGIKDFL